MDGGLLGSLIASAIVLLGGGTKLEINRVSRRDKKIEVLEAIVDAQKQTIAKQDRQLDRFEITAEIQDKFFSQLPQPLQRNDPRRS